MSQVKSWILPVGFLWRAITTCLLILDYWLFSTGNPSVSYSILGGWFWITLFAIAMIVSSYAPPSFRGKEAQPFYGLLSLVGVLSIVLFFASSSAHDYAATHMEAQIFLFMKDPERSDAAVSLEERQLMINLARQKYDKERGAFIPAFREMDYFLKAETGEKYLVRIRMSWDGTPQISLRRVDS